jgi:L-serine deaminase
LPRFVEKFLANMAASRTGETINAARLALSGEGSNSVSLDKVIKTMRDTGRDMKSKV